MNIFSIAREKPINNFKHTLKIMRIALFLLFFSILFTQAATGYSQDVELKLNIESASIKEVCAEIEKQSDFRFVFAGSAKKVIDQKVALTTNSKNLVEILDNIFSNTRLSYRILDNQVVVYGDNADIIQKNTAGAAFELSTQQKKKQITGTVIDKEGKSIIGANIVEKGTTNGTVTDNNGYFRLNIEEEGLLQVSYIGYITQEVKTIGKTTLSIILQEDMQALDELVVVGYGTQNRENLTGAIGHIIADDIASRPTPNIISALQGLMPGLNVKPNSGNPRNTHEINLRGFNSLSGGSPLVLVDGIEGQLEMINPSDIKSITVLKDAASSAIYGARGSFGVILVTTKKGEQGAININYNNNFGWTTQTNKTDYISDPYLHGKIVDAGIYGYNSTSFTNYNDEDWETIQKVARGEIEPFYETMPNGNKKFFYNTDWYRYLFKKWVPSENHDISLSGGSENLNGYFSARYYKTDDINSIATGNLIKYNFKGSLNFKVNDWLTFSSNVQYNTHDEIEYGGTNNGWRDINNAASWLVLYSFEPNFIDGIPYQSTGVGTFAAMESKQSWRKRKLEQLTSSFGFTLNPIKDLIINFDYSNRTNHRDVATRLVPFEFLVGPRIDLQTQGLNRLSESREKNYYNAVNLYGTYNFTLADSHNFKIMTGYNQEDYTSDYILGTQSDLLYSGLANFNLGTNILELSGTATNWAIQGYFGRLNYDFKNRYLLEINARRDGSSRFPHYSRWGLFPSISGGWYMSREKFWEPIEDILNTFKFRFSYGSLGNQNVGLYTFMQTLNPSLANFWLFNGKQEIYVSAPSPLPGVVSWEKTKTIDIGVDLGFFSNRLQASFDWYDKRTEGMYVSGQPLPSVFGASEPRENIAGLKNEGFEISLGYNDRLYVNGKPMNIKATFSLYNYVSKITNFPNPEGVMSSYWEGQRLGDIWGYRIGGQFQSDEEAKAYQNSFKNQTHSLGQVYNFIITLAQNNEWKGLKAGDIKYLDLNQDGEVSRGNYTLDDHGDLEIIGNALPRFPFGFSFSADWNNFDFSFAGAGVSSQDWAPGGVPYWGHYDRPQASFIRKDIIEQAWSPENPEGKFPQIYRGYTALGSNRMLFEPNDYYLENTGYLRIKNLTFGYTIPEHLIKKIQVQNIRIYFSGENIFTCSLHGLTKYVDPEQAGSGIGYNNPGDAVGRSLLEEYPYGKTYSLGLNLTF